MAQYWWVNHKQTFKEEIEGEYLWSPKTNKNGARSEFYLNMRRASPGDLVLSFANQEVRYVGRVAEFAFTSSKPAEFGAKGANWSNEGWYLPVYWTPLARAVRPRELIEVLRPFLPAKYSPIRESGDGNQVYLTHISKTVFDTIVDASQLDFDLLMRGGANSLSYQSIKDRLDDSVEKKILADVTLDASVRDAVIQARRGQGKFRSNVEAIERACRLTGISNPTLLRAGHIKPWRSCESTQERLDGMNGLLLTPDADLLFDRGFITFQDTGKVCVSPRFSREDLRRLGLGDSAWKQLGFSEAPMAWQETSGFTAAQCAYLDYHRSKVYVS